MSKKNVFLKNGEKVLLHETLTNGIHLVERFYDYHHPDGEMAEEPGGKVEAVGEIFLQAPIEVISEEYREMMEKVEEGRQKLRELENECYKASVALREIEKQKTNIEDHVINREEIKNAKSLTFFTEFRPETITETKEKKSLKLSYSVTMWEGKVEEWETQIDYDGRQGFRKSINPKHGILIDATEEEILRIGKEIVANAREIRDHDLMVTIPDEYLSDELKVRKDKLMKERDERWIKSKKEEIGRKEKELEELIANKYQREMLS